MRKLAIFTAAFAAAAAVSVYWLQDVRALWAAGVCLVVSLVGWRLRAEPIRLAALGLAAGLLWPMAYGQLWLGRAAELAGTEQDITVTLLEQPRETQYGSSALCRLEGYDAVLYADESLLDQAPGTHVACTARIEASGLDVSQGESLYLRSNDVVLCLYTQSELETEPGTPSLPIRLRHWLQQRLELLYQGDAAALLRALLTGDRSQLSYAVQNDLSVAGMRHAVAVSGMHVSMLLALLSLLCGRNPRLTAFLGIPVVALFALMTGASASVCRAAVMQILLLCAPLLRREPDPPTSLAAAALVLLIQNPWAIASVSFQLSFAAVAGLLLFSGPIQRRILALSRRPGRVLRFAAGVVSASLGATVLTLPLTVFYFRMVSLAAIAANLLGLWAVTGCFTLGLLSCLLGPAGPVLAWPAALLARYVLALCRILAAWPYAAAYPQNWPLMVWGICAYGLALLWLISKRKLPVLWPLCGLTAAFLVCILAARWQFVRSPWQFTALDVGQGQCLLLRCGDFSAVIDCGGSYGPEAGEQLARTLHSAGVTRTDALILTHYDADHAGGAEQLLHRVTIDSLFLPDMADSSGVRAALEESGSRVFQVNTTMEITFPGGKILLYPPVSGENDNNSGVCVLATAAEYDILVTGDLDQYAEMRLLSRQTLPAVELLVAGHHGSAGATSQILLDTVQPETVLISVGKDNPYGHPAQETLDRIARTGAEILRTDELGTITIKP